MKKPAAITLLVIFGNALTFALGALMIFLIRMWYFEALVLVVYTVLSLVAAKRFNSRLGIGYLKYFLCGVLPAFVLEFVAFQILSSFTSVFQSDFYLTVGVASMIFSGVYNLFFGAGALIVWGREEYGK